MITNDWSQKWTAYHPQKVAVEEFETGRTLTYAQLNALGNKYVKYFVDGLGLTKGERLAILAENCLEYIVLLSLAQKTGIILVPLNYRLTAREIDFLIADSDPKVIIVEEKFAEHIAPSGAMVRVAHKMPLSDLQDITRNFLAEGDSLGENTPETKAHYLHATTHDDAALIIYTSGTTAFPKGSIYTHGMMFWNSINTQLRLDITSADRSVNIAPPFHTGNWNVLLTPFLHHGAYTLIMKTFEADTVLEILQKYDLTLFWAVPTMLKMMAESPNFSDADLSKIRYFVVGGEAMPLSLIKKWHDKNVPIRQGYGLTEVGPNVTSLNHQDAIRKAGSIGKPNFYYGAKLVDAHGKEVANNEPGELILSGPNVTPGYWKNEQATAQTIKDGWFYTGDIMRRDEDGFLFVMDRIKNMYISGAENVYPAEVEFFIRSHPAVDEAAIIGVPDEKWGESGMAFIVPKRNVKLSKEDVFSHCAGNLAKYKIPKHIRLMSELPKNHSGKIDRKQLKEISKK